MRYFVSYISFGSVLTSRPNLFRSANYVRRNFQSGKSYNTYISSRMVTHRVVTDKYFLEGRNLLYKARI